MAGTTPQVRFLCVLNWFDFQANSVQHFRTLLLEINSSPFQCPCLHFSCPHADFQGRLRVTGSVNKAQQQPEADFTPQCNKRLMSLGAAPKKFSQLKSQHHKLIQSFSFQKLMGRHSWFMAFVNSWLEAPARFPGSYTLPWQLENAAGIVTSWSSSWTGSAPLLFSWSAKSTRSALVCKWDSWCCVKCFDWVHSGIIS